MSFNEDTRVKFPATIQFLRLGYDYQSYKDALNNGEIDAETKIIKPRFKKALEKINNREFSEKEIDDIIFDILNVIKYNDLGKDFYNWLVKPNDRVKLIDFDNVDNNDFAVLNELVFGLTNDGSFRPDINILINGIPLAFLEVKKPNNEGGIQVEFKRMINDRLEKEEHKKYFNLIQLISFSNNMEYENDDDSADDPKAGSFYTSPNGNSTTFSFFREEEPKSDGFINIENKTIEDILIDNGYSKEELYTAEFETNLDLQTPCNKFITSVFEKERFLYLIKYGIMYVDDKFPQKHIMRYPQFFATRKIRKMLENGTKSGIVWHTQGSGKTALSAFANRVINDYYAKRNINARFFFVVDRIDLLTQASQEFINRDFNVKNVSSRNEFQKELNKTLSTNTKMDSIGDFTVVNIHKFSDEMPKAKNDYDANVQRIIFIDEAHRSYSTTGEFFKNLMLVDQDAIFIALTGTPLLSKKERSNLKFGDYIHKYFYDKSIADGYTLRIKKEEIDTVAKQDIKKNLDLENATIKDKDIYESDDYIDSLGRFINKDFENFRYQNLDDTIGGMIVCSSNNQAKKIQKWFEENSKFATGIVITDEEISSQQNKKYQLAFQKENYPDILVVHQMLTTGYDVKRLKKMYLLRNAKEHTLLQTISRVNRPYKNPNGKSYKYGYIVDFVDIEAEYDRTIKQYLKELEEDFGEEDGHLDGLVVDKDDINKKYLDYVNKLDDIIDTDNLEKFSKRLLLFNKDTLYNIKNLLNKINDCYVEFLLSKARDLANQIDIRKNKQLLREVKNRISFINLTERPTDTINILSNDEIVEIIYDFVKVRISIMDLGIYQNIPDIPGLEKVIDVFKEVQKEIKKNKHKEDIKVVKLDKLLADVFRKLEIANLDDLESVNEDLLVILNEIKSINEENERLASVYDGSYAFVKTYNDCMENYPDYDKNDIEQVLQIINSKLKEIANKNDLLLQGRSNFISSIKQLVTIELVKRNLYAKLNLKGWFDILLGELFVNISQFK